MNYTTPFRPPSNDPPEPPAPQEPLTADNPDNYERMKARSFPTGSLGPVSDNSESLSVPSLELPPGAVLVDEVFIKKIVQARTYLERSKTANKLPDGSTIYDFFSALMRKESFIEASLMSLDDALSDLLEEEDSDSNVEG